MRKHTDLCFNQYVFKRNSAVDDDFYVTDSDILKQVKKTIKEEVEKADIKPCAFSFSAVERRASKARIAIGTLVL